MADDEAFDVEFALEPVKRAPVLEQLIEGPATRAELQDHLGVSRATLHRVVRGFAEDGLVEETDAGVELTGAGASVADAVGTYIGRMRAAERLTPLLNQLPSTVDFDVDAFADAEIVTPAEGHPQRPVQRVIDFVEAAASLRGTGAMVLPIYVEVLTREITGGMATELIVTPPVIDALLSEYPDRLRDALDSGNLDLLVSDGVSVGVALDGERALLVGTEAGVAQVAVVSDAPAAVDWAESAYERTRAEAEPYQPTE